MKTYVKVLALLSVLLALILSIEVVLFFLSKTVYIKIDDTRYERSASSLDLRGKDISLEHYNHLRKELPRCEIRWDVPFQGKRYDSETERIEIRELTMDEVEQLDLLPRLKQVDAEECRDLRALAALRKRRPDCTVNLSVFLGDMRIEEDAEALVLEKKEITADELRDAMGQLKNLKEIYLQDPEIPGMELRAMREEFPQVEITWNKPVMGVEYPEDIEEIDLSNTSPESLEQVESLMAYYPNLKKLTMEHCGFADEDMAVFRERVRSQYKVIWGVQVGEAYVRTDQQGFIPSNSGARVRNEDAGQLKYCEGLIAVDLGHTGTTDLSWVTGTPHLKYLIMGDGNVFNEDVAHLACLKELEYLELFHCPVSDISPLTECTALKDILLSSTYVTNVEPLTKLPNLEHIWLINNGLGYNTRVYLEEHFPNAVIQVGGGSDHGRGWRDMDSYFDMRDVLGMWYMKG